MRDICISSKPGSLLSRILSWVWKWAEKRWPDRFERSATCAECGMEVARGNEQRHMEAFH